MLVIPAIDLKSGRCVRLTEGREDSAKVYDRDPLEVALSYERAGARLIHVVDLDAAIAGGNSENRQIIRKIAHEIRAPIQVGGGVRGIADIASLIEDVGACYVIVGTMAVEDPDALENAVAKFGDSMVVAIDARENEAAVRGWTQPTAIDALELAKRVAALGVVRIIYTDIARDGRLVGPNLEMTRRIAQASGISVTASGGVGTLEDIDRLSDLEVYGVHSVIVGKALYEARFSLESAIARTTQ